MYHILMKLSCCSTYSNFLYWYFNRACLPAFCLMACSEAPEVPVVNLGLNHRQDHVPSNRHINTI